MSRPFLRGLTVLACLTAALTAQQPGSIRGVVFDKDFEAPLPGAVVQIQETGQRTVTNDQGTFLFPQVKPGPYSIVVQKDGYLTEFSKTAVGPGQLQDVRFELVGDFTDLEEFVVQDALQISSGNEQALLDLRLESPALLDSISRDLMSKAGVGDAKDALRLVSGASTQDSGAAVIRGLPDRYVASSLNGVLLPSSDEDKRAIPLDQFQSSVLDSVQVAKTFTPDQQGNASGGAVNIVLRGLPEEPLFFNWSVGTSYNDQVNGRSDFLTYDDGGVHGFGKSGSDRAIQQEGENWEGAVGATTGEVPDNFKWTGALGGRVDIGGGWRLGGLANFTYDRSSSFYENGRDETRVIRAVGELMSPNVTLGQPQSPPFVTSLLSLDRSQQSVQWGGLLTGSLASDDHAISATLLFTRIATDTVTVGEDTQGKEYFYPGHDPDDPLSPGWSELEGAPYTRQQTLTYNERGTRSIQVAGQHRIELFGWGPLRGMELDWNFSRNNAFNDTPDRRQFASIWRPTGDFDQLRPAADFALGNLQRTFIRIDETSEQLALNLKLPFEVFGGRKAYFKAGFFNDDLTRTFRQETFSNFSDPITTPWNSDFFSGIDWSQNWRNEEHLIFGSPLGGSGDPNANPGPDVDYDGSQRINASYAMLELPLTEDLKLVGGVRWENTRIGIRPDWEDQAFWVPRFQPDGQINLQTAEFPARPGDPDFDPDLFAQVNPQISQSDVLPSIAFIYDIYDDLTLRGSYSETLARQTFKELAPVFFQEYIGGPIFLGEPTLQISNVENWDLRLDYTPTPGSLFSVSYFKKFVTNPIEYVEFAIPFSLTKPVNYQRGTLSGWEVELRQDIGTLFEPMAGLSVGGNATWIDSSVRIPQAELENFVRFQGVLPQTSRDMTDAPDWLWNAFLTYDVGATGTSFAAFYTVTGDTLLQGPGPGDTQFTPATYDREYDNLTLTLRQQLGRGVQLSLSAKNLTDATRRQVYRSEFLPDDVTRREFRNGVTYSLSISGSIVF